MLLSNKELVLRFYKQVIGERNIPMLPQFIAADYRQHSPQLKDGFSGLQEALLQLAAGPPLPAPQVSPVQLILEDGAFVVLLCCFAYGGQTQWVLDVFRLAEGLITEHWDAVQETDPDQVTAPGYVTSTVRRIFRDERALVQQSLAGDATKTYAVYDIYDLNHNVVTRHRRIAQEIPPHMPHTNGMI